MNYTTKDLEKMINSICVNINKQTDLTKLTAAIREIIREMKKPEWLFIHCSGLSFPVPGQESTSLFLFVVL